MPENPFVIHVARLRRVKGSRWHEVRTGPVDPEGVTSGNTPIDSSLVGEANAICDVHLESFEGGVMVTGRVTAPWRGICRRCTVPVAGEFVVSVRERFTEPGGRYADPEDEEAYAICEDELDLRPMIHEALVLELPLAPLCRSDCQGICPWCGIDRNEGACACVAPGDPRWANLDVLRPA